MDIKVFISLNWQDVDNIINEHFNAYAAEIKAAFDEGLKSYRL